MIALRDLQVRMLEAVLGDTTEHALPLIDAPDRVAAARLGVYRNTVERNLADALRSTYPAVWRLVGEDYFRQTARGYGRRYPSRCGDLTQAGASFPAYLAELHGADQYRYLADVARLELDVQTVLLAPEPAPLDLERLATVAPARHDSLRFVLHPALRLFESPYPVLRIWQSNVGSEAEPPTLDLHSGGERLAVLRQRLQLQFQPLTRGEWCWLEALGRGMPFAASVEAAELGAAQAAAVRAAQHAELGAAAGAADDGFDAAAALQRFVALGAIVDF